MMHDRTDDTLNSATAGFLPLGAGRFGARLRAAAWHLLLSACVAAVAAGLVFGLWYPGDYRSMSGGRELFLLVTGVDIVLGPLLTFAVFDVRKGWPHLRRDLTVIVVLQLAGLAYGMHTVYVARPVAMVFETDRFRVVTALEVHTPELPQARAEFRRLPLTGPWLIGTRAAEPGKEKLDALFMALEGVDTGVRPSFWVPYDEVRAAVLDRSRPAQLLLDRYPQRKAEIEAVLEQAGLEAAKARFLPVIARGDWVALLGESGNVGGFVPLDGFF